MGLPALFSLQFSVASKGPWCTWKPGLALLSWVLEQPTCQTHGGVYPTLKAAGREAEDTVLHVLQHPRSIPGSSPSLPVCCATLQLRMLSSGLEGTDSLALPSTALHSDAWCLDLLCSLFATPAPKSAQELEYSVLRASLGAAPP